MYQKLIGKLIYLSHTRPDIAYAVNVVSQFMYHPKEAYLQVVCRILQYLKGSPGRGILFRRNIGLSLEGYANVDCRISYRQKVNYRLLYFYRREFGYLEK